jgi:hypothetical protein
VGVGRGGVIEAIFLVVNGEHGKNHQEVLKMPIRVLSLLAIGITSLDCVNSAHNILSTFYLVKD